MKNLLNNPSKDIIKIKLAIILASFCSNLVGLFLRIQDRMFKLCINSLSYTWEYTYFTIKYSNLNVFQWIINFSISISLVLQLISLLIFFRAWIKYSEKTNRYYCKAKLYKIEYLTLNLILLISVPKFSYYLGLYSDSISFKIDHESYFILGFILMGFSFLSIFMVYILNVYISIRVTKQNEQFYQQFSQIHPYHNNVSHDFQKTQKDIFQTLLNNIKPVHMKDFNDQREDNSLKASQKKSQKSESTQNRNKNQKNSKKHINKNQFNNIQPCQQLRTSQNVITAYKIMPTIYLNDLQQNGTQQISIQKNQSFIKLKKQQQTKLYIRNIRNLEKDGFTVSNVMNSIQVKLTKQYADIIPLKVQIQLNNHVAKSDNQKINKDQEKDADKDSDGKLFSSKEFYQLQQQLRQKRLYLRKHLLKKPKNFKSSSFNSLFIPSQNLRQKCPNQKYIEQQQTYAHVYHQMMKNKSPDRKKQKGMPASPIGKLCFVLKKDRQEKLKYSNAIVESFRDNILLQSSFQNQTESNIASVQKTSQKQKKKTIQMIRGRYDGL